MTALLRPGDDHRIMMEPAVPLTIWTRPMVALRQRTSMWAEEHGVICSAGGCVMVFDDFVCVSMKSEE